MNSIANDMKTPFGYFSKLFFLCTTWQGDSPVLSESSGPRKCILFAYRVFLFSLPGCVLHWGAFQVVPVEKNPLANAGDVRDANSIPGLGRCFIGISRGGDKLGVAKWCSLLLCLLQSLKAPRSEMDSFWAPSWNPALWVTPLNSPKARKK